MPDPTFESVSAMRRAHAAMVHELTEFGIAAGVAEIRGMNTARRMAHEYLDAYLDNLAATHSAALKMLESK